MENNYQAKIEARILSSQGGSMFIPPDFSDIAESEVVNQALCRLQKKNTIRRVIRGVYEYPQYSGLLGEYAAPSVDKVAAALARYHGWTIIPCGDTALNLFGLSTQVPAAWTYISDGPYREYQLDRILLQFKRTTNKDISRMSYKTALLIQAIKALGKENIDEKMRRKLAKGLRAEEKTLILSEAQYSTAWIYSIIKKICNEGNVQ